MIDPADRQTQALPLDEQPAKRKRGRPATGKALSNAERQRLYRERQKEQRVENMHKDVAEGLRAELANAIERAELAEAEVERWKKLARGAERARQSLASELSRRNEKTAKMKRHRDDTPNKLKEYHAETWDRDARKWKTIGGDHPDNLPFNDWQEAEAFVKQLLAGGSTSRYRIVPANLPVREYK